MRIAAALPNDATAPRAARHWLRDQLRHSTCDPGSVDTGVLLVNELVTNAVVHGAGPVHVTADLSTPTVRVEVHDESQAAPARRPPGENGGGWGLYLVDRLARRHGHHVEAQGPGKTVWFELDC